MKEERAPVGGRLFTLPFLVCLVVAAIAAVLLVKRYTQGIGAVSNMNDGYAWGLWVTYDIIIGTGLACGGFAMALLVYILNKGQYHPLVRPALLASLLGYTMAGISILIDVGRYWQGYNILLPKYMNFNSVMLEVALCVSTYIGVLWIEFSPTFLEGWGAKETAKKVGRFLFIFIALGILLPTMHQSSLGSLMIISGHKLNPLWQTTLLPLLFLLSAITMGYCAVVFESYLASRAFKRPAETPILAKVSGIVAWLLVFFLVFRFGDLVIRGQLGLAFRGDLNGNMFLIESLLFIVPAVMLLPKANRSKPRTLFSAGGLMLLAGAVYRLNVFLVGFNPASGWRYFPSVAEMTITLGVIALEVMLYLIIVKKFPVLPRLEHA